MIWRAVLPLVALAASITFAAPVRAHPHVFVDGEVDFVFRDGTALEALRVTWLYDDFETLYILSSYEIGLNAQGGLDEADRQALIRHRSTWPADFDGSAHLSVGGTDVALEWPEALDAHLVDGRLQVTFTRRLTQALDLSRGPAEVAFYESTYFFAFSITKSPALIGATGTCAATILPFQADAQTAELQDILQRLSREETPADENVGALFADRIAVQCG